MQLITFAVFGSLSLLSRTEASSNLRGQTRNLKDDDSDGCLGSSIFSSMPTEPCPVGQSIMYDFKECAWVCKVTSTGATTNAESRSLVASLTQAKPETTTPQSKRVSVRDSDDLCMLDTMSDPMPGPCGAGFAAKFNFKECQWVCKAVAGPAALGANVDSEDGNNNNRPASPGFYGGSVGGTTTVGRESVEEGDDEDRCIIGTMPAACPAGQAAMYSFRECSWVCKTPAYTSSSRTFTAAVSSKSSELCTYSPLNNPKPQPCPALNFAIVFDFEECDWMCKELPPSQPATGSVISVPTEGEENEQERCPAGNLPVFVQATGVSECAAISLLDCGLGEYAVYDPILNAFNCE